MSGRDPVHDQASLQAFLLAFRNHLLSVKQPQVSTDAMFELLCPTSWAVAERISSYPGYKTTMLVLLVSSGTCPLNSSTPGLAVPTRPHTGPAEGACFKCRRGVQIQSKLRCLFKVFNGNKQDPVGLGCRQRGHARVSYT